MNTHVRPAQLTTGAADPLAAIVAAIAKTKGRLRRMQEAEVRSRLRDADDTMSADELYRQLWDKREALTTLASHIQATTPGGALLQALVALDVELPTLWAEVPTTFRDSAAGERFCTAYARLQRLLYSVVYAAEPLCDDLRLLRDSMAPRGFDGIAQVEELDAVPPR